MYWVDHKQVGPDAEAAIAALQAHRHVTVAVYSSTSWRTGDVNSGRSS